MPKMRRDLRQAAAAVRLTFVRYRGQLVAAAAPDRVYLAPSIAERAPGDPLLRFTAVMCLYVHDLESGELAGCYDDAAAELYARCVLIPDAEFLRRLRDPDRRLAHKFRVPLEQIAAKRTDLARQRHHRGPTRRSRHLST